MAGLVVKLIGYPLLVILASYLFPNVNYANLTQPILIGLILAIVGHLMEILILERGSFWVSTITDFISSFVIVYFVSWLLPQAFVTVWGALLTSVLLTLAEIVQHRWLIKSGRTRKSPASP